MGAGLGAWAVSLTGATRAPTLAQGAPSAMARGVGAVDGCGAHWAR